MGMDVLKKIQDNMESVLVGRKGPVRRYAGYGKNGHGKDPGSQHGR